MKKKKNKRIQLAKSRLRDNQFPSTNKFQREKDGDWTHRLKVSRDIPTRQKHKKEIIRQLRTEYTLDTWY